MEKNKLSHLSKQEIEEVISLYKDKSVKITDILEKYKIDVTPSNLSRILSGVAVEDCPYCHIPMIQKVRKRTSYQDENKICYNCGHIKYEDSRLQEGCNCDGCKKKKEETLKYLQGIVTNTYNKKIQKVNFCELDLKSQIDLIYVIRNNPNRNTSEIIPNKTYIYLKNNEKAMVNKLKRLMKKGIISISTKTSIYAFNKKDFPYNPDLNKSTFDINVTFLKDDIEKINGSTYFNENADEEELCEILKEYIYDDVIAKFSSMMEKRRLKLVVSEKGSKNLKMLINKISYAEIINLCWKVSKYYSDKVVTGEIGRQKAGMMACSSVLTFYNNAINNGWELSRSNCDYVGDELNEFVTSIMCKKIELLHYPPTVENILLIDNEKYSDKLLVPIELT